ncbi:hypothetical protein [Amphritea japonica]|nr:hypothetical protein [Amphritea japonica]
MCRFTVATCFFTLILAGCATPEKPESPIYGGTGGMTEWNILPNVYLFHYENGFTGVDALGYDAKLQSIWSRLGAAQSCDIHFDTQIMISKLINQYGETAITHELNGIGFHRVQSRRIPKFCDKQRVGEINKAVKRYKRGDFN